MAVKDRARLTLCRLLGVVCIAGVLLGFGALLLRPYRTFATIDEKASLGLDLGDPDLLVSTISLAWLPRDLLTIPLFKDVFTEDFVFYYEQNEARLSLRGTLRRIAYEHDLDLLDWVIRTVIDEPTEMAAWKGPDGRLKHYLIAMTRNNLAKLLEMAAKVALADTQLTRVAGDLTVDGEPIPVFALRYLHDRTLLFATRGDRLVILSDAGMLAEPNGKAQAERDKEEKNEEEKTEEDRPKEPPNLTLAKSGGEAEEEGGRRVVADLLSRDPTRQARYRDRFKLTAGGSQHTVAATVRYLSFGYQRFFPALRALRFDFGQAGWSTQVLLDPEAWPKGGLNTRALWKMVPTEPCACAALPVAWKLVPGLLQPLGADEQEASRALARLEGPVAVCWYATSGVYTPVFVVPLQESPGAADAADTKLLGTIFAAGIGSKEPDLSDQEDPRFPVVTSQRGETTHLWRRDVSSRYGLRGRPGNKKEQAAGDRAFQVTLAQHPRGVVFSPDDRLVENVLTVADRRFPALADSLPDEEVVLAVIIPSSLSTLLQTEAFASLPADVEPVFRNAASTHLVPKLAALKRYPAYALVLPGPVQPAADRWLPVRWQEFGRP